jgi:hypothetical protein
MSVAHYPEYAPRDREIVHDANNQISMILAFAELAVEELEPHDARRSDVVQMPKAAQAAFGGLPELDAFVSPGAPR